MLYTGYDVVKEVTDYNQWQYSSLGIQFVCAELNQCLELTADLLIVKDVFQHLPPSHCLEFVRTIPERFKYNLITNDHGGNNEIEIGDYGGNDFTLPPFNMSSELLIEWQQKSPASGNKQTVTIKGKLNEQDDHRHIGIAPHRAVLRGDERQ